MRSKWIAVQFSIGALLGAVIACSPTRFTPGASNSTTCDQTNNCVVDQNGFRTYQTDFEIGAGKVDILFIQDNSASMSIIQEMLKSRFSGFVQNLDSQKIDYRMAITTTDLEKVKAQKLIPLSNGKTFLTSSDADRVSLFQNAIVRTETLKCENLIVTMFNTYGPSFQSNGDYVSRYSSTCPSPDNRGIYTGNIVIKENADSFLRDDANLNVILISNDEERQGSKTFEDQDRAESFMSMMNSTYPTKFWNFNSIVVKDGDQACLDQQTLKNAQGVTVTNVLGKPSIAGGYGKEASKISNSGTTNIDGNAVSRGQVLSICETDYSKYFKSIATQIADSSRMLNLSCTPSEEPTITITSQVNNGIKPSYTWNADKITFQKGFEGASVHVSYRCYTGVK